MRGEGGVFFHILKTKMPSFIFCKKLSKILMTKRSGKTNGEVKLFSLTGVTTVRVFAFSSRRHYSSR